MSLCQCEALFIHTAGRNRWCHFEAMVETMTFVSIYRGMITPGLLRWCELDFVHPQYGGSLVLVAFVACFFFLQGLINPRSTVQ